MLNQIIELYGQIISNLAVVLQCWVTEQKSNTKEEEQAVEDSK